MPRNRYYKLFTEYEIPEQEIRAAVNCFYAAFYNCSDIVYDKCMKNCPELWVHCPKQTKKEYKHKEETINLPENVCIKKKEN
jgi:hypothetical protein